MEFQLPIMIPSKGRAGKTKTDKLLRSAGLSYSFVIEPQERNDYAATGSPFIELPLNDQGITYSRQFILDHVRKYNYPYFWMIDDDIEYFGQVIDGKTVKSDASVLKKAFNQLSFYGDASLYSLELCQFAWTANEAQKNKIAMQCVLFDMKNCKNLNYDLRLKIREDYDLSFQAIFNGKGTLKSGKYFYNIADMKSQEGGMSQWYNPVTELHESHKLCQKWPGIVEVINKDNRIDVKVNWKKLK